MHELLATQTLSPIPQLHVPPAPGQVSPVTLQAAAGQQLVVGMHRVLVVQKVWPVGQLHEPPGPEHVPLPTHWTVVQQVLAGMHELNGGDAVVQTEPPLTQTQVPPGAVQVWPVKRQSSARQHVLVGIHELLTVHALYPEAQPHVPPGAEQVSPVTEQSALVQHSVLGMQALLATQAW
jgi:hypothetical protein